VKAQSTYYIIWYTQRGWTTWKFRECCYNVSCSIISLLCLRCMLCWSLCGGTVGSFRYATKYVRRPTLVVQGVKLKAVSDSSIFEKAHRLYYKGFFTRLLAVERTTSLLNCDIWRRPFCNAQSRVVKTPCTSNVWPYTAVRGFPASLFSTLPHIAVLHSLDCNNAILQSFCRLWGCIGSNYFNYYTLFRASVQLDSASWWEIFWIVIKQYTSRKN